MICCRSGFGTHNFQGSDISISVRSRGWKKCRYILPSLIQKSENLSGPLSTSDFLRVFQLHCLAFSSNSSNVMMPTQFASGIGFLDNISATWFIDPFRYFISKSYCCKNILHLANLPEGLLIVRNHFSDWWSVKTIKWEPSR